MTEAETGRCVYKTRDTKACQWVVGTWENTERVLPGGLGRN